LRIWGRASGAAVNRKFTNVDGNGGAAEIFRGTAKALTVTGLQIDGTELCNIDKAIEWGVKWGEKHAKEARAEQERARADNGFNHSGGRYSIDDFDKIVRDGHPDGTDRSAVFHSTVGHFIGIGWSVDKILELLEKHPSGIGARYIAEGRLRGEIERSANAFGGERQQDEEPAAGGGREQDDPDDDDPDDDGPKASKGHDREPPHSWEDPDFSLLDDRRGDLPVFPLDILSEPVRAWAIRAARGAGVTHDHVVVPALGIVSGLIGTGRRVQATTSWISPLALWAALVGFSGSGKTPGINATKKALNDLARNQQIKIAALERAHQAKVERAKAVLEKWKDAVAKAAKEGKISPEMPADAVLPGKFIAPRLYISDGTIERFGELLSARPQGVLRLQDELAGMFSNMSRYSGGSDREFWLESWNGDAYTVERVSRNLYLDHLMIAVVGGMQPDKLRASFEGDADGMYGRILFSWPREAPFIAPNDGTQEVDPEIYTALARVNGLAEFTAEGKLVDRKIKLSAGARQEFTQFAQFAHEGKAALEGREREWFSKMTAHVLRLAGTIAILDWAMGPAVAPPELISEEAMGAAIELVRDYFCPHARAALRQIGLSDKHANARRVLLWIKAMGVANVSREDVRRDALGQRLDADATNILLDALVRAGFLHKETTPQPGRGRPVVRWAVNPLLVPPTAGNAGNAENSREAA
jgi:Protein of unknown function (DUF3987)